MEFPHIEIPVIDMVKGVGEIVVEFVVEEARLFFHKIVGRAEG